MKRKKEKKENKKKRRIENKRKSIFTIGIQMNGKREVGVFFFNAMFR